MKFGIKRNKPLTPQETKYTHYQFMNLFTPEEVDDMIELEGELNDDEAILRLCPNVDASEVATYRKHFRKAFKLYSMADQILKSDPNTIAFVNLLEASGLLGVGRAAEILGE